MNSNPYCPYCKKFAHQIYEMVALAKANGTTPAEEARNDGTYNPTNNHFCCTMCYIHIGTPSSPVGWLAR